MYLSQNLNVMPWKNIERFGNFRLWWSYFKDLNQWDKAIPSVCHFLNGLFSHIFVFLVRFWALGYTKNPMTNLENQLWQICRTRRKGFYSIWKERYVITVTAVHIRQIKFWNKRVPNSILHDNFNIIAYYNYKDPLCRYMFWKE